MGEASPRFSLRLTVLFFRFNPRQNKWRTLAPMQKERCRFPLAVFGSKFLFAFGGCSEHGESSEEEEEDDDGVQVGQAQDVNAGHCER